MRLLAVLAVAASLGGATVAHASPTEVFGFGSTQAGLAGAVAARVDDFSSGYYNPAGLAFGVGQRVSFGVSGAASRLRVNDESYQLTNPYGIVFGASTPAPLGGPLANVLHVGLGMYVLPDTVARVIARQPEEPLYPYYDNRIQRLVILPTASVRVRPWLAFGVGINVLAGLAGQVIAVEGPTRGLEPRVDEEIGTVARLNVGARATVWPGYDLAVVFRQAFDVPFSTTTDNEVAGEPIDLDIRAKGLYTPNQVVLGQAWRAGSTVFSLDATWADWSKYPGPYVQVESELPLVGPLAGELPVVPWKDTFGGRLGVEHRFGADGGGAALRAGYAFETAATPEEQPGVTNLLDGPKHTVALGFGWRTRALGHAVSVDLHSQAQIVGSRTLHKSVAAPMPGQGPPPLFDALRDEVVDDPQDPATTGAQVSNPGYPSIESGGAVLSGGLTVEIAL